MRQKVILSKLKMQTHEQIHGLGTQTSTKYILQSSIYFCLLRQNEAKTDFE